jgi:hypothetical protein
MSGSLLDTSVLVAPGTSGPELPPSAAISIVTLGELHAGVLLARDDGVRDARRRRLDAVRSAFSPLIVDEPVARRYGQILAFARSRRRTEKATDLLIIATAAATDRTLYTRDVHQAQLARAADVPVATV